MSEGLPVSSEVLSKYVCICVCTEACIRRVSAKVWTEGVRVWGLGLVAQGYVCAYVGYPQSLCSAFLLA